MLSLKGQAARAVMGAMRTVMEGGVSALGDVLSNLDPSKLAGLAGLGGDLIGRAASGLEAVMNTLGGMVSGAAGGQCPISILRDAIGGLVGVLRAGGEGLAQGVIDGVGKVFGALQGALEAAASGGLGGGALGQLGGALTGLIGGLLNGVVGTALSALGGAGGLGGALNFLSGLGGGLRIGSA